MYWYIGYIAPPPPPMAYTNMNQIGLPQRTQCCKKFATSTTMFEGDSGSNPNWTKRVRSCWLWTTPRQGAVTELTSPTHSHTIELVKGKPTLLFGESSGYFSSAVVWPVHTHLWEGWVGWDHGWTDRGLSHSTFILWHPISPPYHLSEHIYVIPGGGEGWLSLWETNQNVMASLPLSHQGPPPPPGACNVHCVY